MCYISYVRDHCCVKRVGADATLSDVKGKTALQWAQLNSRTDVGLLLNARVAK